MEKGGYRIYGTPKSGKGAGVKGAGDWGSKKGESPGAGSWKKSGAYTTESWPGYKCMPTHKRQTTKGDMSRMSATHGVTKHNPNVAAKHIEPIYRDCKPRNTLTDTTGGSRWGRTTGKKPNKGYERA